MRTGRSLWPGPAMSLRNRCRGSSTINERTFVGDRLRRLHGEAEVVGNLPGWLCSKFHPHGARQSEARDAASSEQFRRDDRTALDMVAKTDEVHASQFALLADDLERHSEAGIVDMLRQTSHRRGAASIQSCALAAALTS